MSFETPVLHMLCGKIAAGKSTLAGRLARAPATVVICEDAWLAALFSGEMASGADYLRCSQRLRQAIGSHVTGLLKAGVSVVLDFPANTVQNRAWMRSLLEGTGAAHQLHLLRATEAQCLARLAARNAGGAHPFAVSEAQFHRFSRHFEPPTAEEGFTIVEHETGP